MNTSFESLLSYSIGGVPIVTYGMIGLTTVVLAAATIFDDQTPAEKNADSSASLTSFLPTLGFGSNPNEPEESSESSGILSTIGLGGPSQPSPEKERFFSSNDTEKSTPPSSISNTLFGGPTATPTSANDTLFGGPVKDTLQNDTLFGGPVKETLQNDTLFGQPAKPALPNKSENPPAVGGKNKKNKQKKTKRYNGGNIKCKKYTKRSKN